MANGCVKKGYEGVCKRRLFDIFLLFVVIFPSLRHISGRGSHCMGIVLCVSP